MFLSEIIARSTCRLRTQRSHSSTMRLHGWRGLKPIAMTQTRSISQLCNGWPNGHPSNGRISRIVSSSLGKSAICSRSLPQLRNPAWNIWVITGNHWLREIIPFYGWIIQLSEILQYRQYRHIIPYMDIYGRNMAMCFAMAKHWGSWQSWCGSVWDGWPFGCCHFCGQLLRCDLQAVPWKFRSCPIFTRGNNSGRRRIFTTGCGGKPSFSEKSKKK